MLEFDIFMKPLILGLQTFDELRVFQRNRYNAGDLSFHVSESLIFTPDNVAVHPQMVVRMQPYL